MPGEKPGSVYRKKRPKVFYKKKNSSSAPSVQTTRPTPVITASRKKLALSSPHLLQVAPPDPSTPSTSSGVGVSTVSSSTAGPSNPSSSESAAGKEMRSLVVSCWMLGSRKLGSVALVAHPYS